PRCLRSAPSSRFTGTTPTRSDRGRGKGTGVLLWALRQRRLERQGTRDLARAAATWPDLIMQRRVDLGTTLALDRSFLLSEITLPRGGPGGGRPLDPQIKSLMLCH